MSSVDIPALYSFNGGSIKSESALNASAFIEYDEITYSSSNRFRKSKTLSPSLKIFSVEI